MLNSIKGDFEKSYDGISKCGRWSYMLDEIFLDIAVLTSGLSMLWKILTIIVLLLEARTSRKVLTWSGNYWDLHPGGQLFRWLDLIDYLTRD